MGYVSKEQIAHARQVGVLEYILACESGDFRRTGKGYRMKEHPSLAVSEKGWYWHSEEIGGKTALDYLTAVRGYGLVDAVCILLKEKPVERVPSRQSVSPLKRKPFALPVRNSDNRRVIAYLQSRGIDKPLILDCIKRGSLYESKGFHNAIFVGRDEYGKARYAAMRGTLSAFKCDAEGSDKKYGFVLPPKNPDSHEIAVYEAPIDALSHQTLCEQGFIPVFDGWRLALGGGSILTLEHFLQRHPHITHCCVCSDNDKAGNAVADKIAGIPGVISVRDPPVYGNDWNNTLQSLQKAQRTQNKARHNHSPCR
ncbi:MAG: DUF3991 and toprim domain-containing protein [Oscillospiraceae bacterium]|nr:DUF3991 and toprim domain-containing protein [Oscillospiraceae bacterium]